MTIQIGENIKKYRKVRGITQEDLALALGISFQAVSKWERGETYPDITMLPALAGYFEVSTDELIGMEDITKSREDTFNFHRIVTDLQRDGKYEEAIVYIRERLRLRPGDRGVISALAASQVMAHSSDETIFREAIEHFESYLDIGRNEKFYSYVRAMLCFMYYKTGELERAQAFAKTLPHIWESREMLSIEMLDDEEYAQALRRTAELAVSILADKIKSIDDGRDDVAGVHLRNLVLAWPSQDDMAGALAVVAEFLG